jgi:hypothetical protein
MKVVVTGGRTYDDKEFLYKALDEVHASEPIELLIEGGAKGADRLGRYWAMDRDVEHQTVKANWGKYGRGAGVIRNYKMLEMLDKDVDMLVVFPGGRGTADCQLQAERLGIMVFEAAGED